MQREGNALKELKVPAALRPWPVLTAIALNLVPVIGVLFWGWSAFALIFLYWIENVVVGARTLVSMLTNGLVTNGPAGLAAGAGLGTFFTLHYGLFCTVHGLFVLLMFGGTTFGDDVNMDLNLFGVAARVFERTPDLLVGFASIVAWQVVQFVLFITRGEVRRTNLLSLMGEPYPRMVLLHVTIIFGGFLVMLLNEPLWGVVLLAVLKAGFDVRAAIAESQKPATPVPANAP